MERAEHCGPGACRNRGRGLVRRGMPPAAPTPVGVARRQEFGAEVVAQLPCSIDGEPPHRLDAAGDSGDGRVMTDRDELDRVGSRWSAMTCTLCIGPSSIGVKAPVCRVGRRPGPPYRVADSPDNLPRTLRHDPAFPQVSTPFGGRLPQDAGEPMRVQTSRARRVTSEDEEA
jgi:hypothetical protein